MLILFYTTFLAYIFAPSSYTLFELFQRTHTRGYKRNLENCTTVTQIQRKHNKELNTSFNV